METRFIIDFLEKLRKFTVNLNRFGPERQSKRIRSLTFEDGATLLCI